MRVSGPNNSSGTKSIVNFEVFVAQSIPAQMEEGQVYNISIAAKNTGTSAWIPNEYKLKVINRWIKFYLRGLNKERSKNN